MLQLFKGVNAMGLWRTKKSEHKTNAEMIAKKIRELYSRWHGNRYASTLIEDLQRVEIIIDQLKTLVDEDRRKLEQEQIRRK